MVKLKEGYVMSHREQAEFERINALPRKNSGRVDYYFKPRTKYPPRIYVFMHAEIWCDRNRRPMGLYHAIPFLSRPMNREEIEYHHFDHRLCYHQYEDWDRLICAEEKEAAELDRERSGSGSSFLTELKTFQSRYTLKNSLIAAPVRTAPADNSESTYLNELLKKGSSFTAKEISALIDKEQKGEHRLTILILLRELYKNSVRDEKDKIEINGKLIDRKVWLLQERTRKNFVRRVFKNNKLFALAEISVRYPDYSEEMLLCDLIMKRKRIKKAKHKPVVDLRRCQLNKLARKLACEELSADEYSRTCNRIVLLQHAHNCRLPVPLSVTLNNETLVYSFHWRTRENVVKSFVALANSKGMTHETLGNRHHEMCRSAYSY